MKKIFLSNQSGFITVDFLFAFVLILGFSALLFALTFTLTVVEIAQYSTYASARVYMAGHKTEAQQKQLANDKYLELIGKNRVFSPLFKNGWFKVQTDPMVGNIVNYMQDYGRNPVNSFWGVATVFNAEILKMNIPLWGSTDPDDRGFRATIGSYLGREPTSAECSAHARMRWEGILNLKPSRGSSYDNGRSTGYTPFIDDGC